MRIPRGATPRRFSFRLRSWQPAAIAVVLGIDAILAIMRRKALDRPTEAVLDESAHLLTGLVILDALGVRRRTPFWSSAVAASVLIDVDHVPSELGYRFLTRGEPRPYSHSLATIGLLAGLSLNVHGVRRQVTRGAAVGVALHLVRDVATGGVPLLWPAVRGGVQLPYGVYPALLGAATRLGRRPATPTERVASSE